VSAIAVHNAILERRPDLHALLCQPYYHSREGEAGGKQKHYPMPIFGMRDGRFTSQYSTTFVENAQHIPGVPKLTAAQDEALTCGRRSARSCATRWRSSRAISSS
jgi:hypothetical protein